MYPDHTKETLDLVYLESSEFTTLADITDIKYSLIWDAATPQSFLQQLRRLKDIFLSQNPRSPMDAHCPLTTRVFKNIDASSLLAYGLDVKKEDSYLSNGFACIGDMIHRGS